MDVQDAGGELVDGSAEAHGLQEGLDERRCLGAEEVSAEQQPGGWVGEDFYKLRVSSRAQP